METSTGSTGLYGKKMPIGGFVIRSVGEREVIDCHAACRVCTERERTFSGPPVPAGARLIELRPEPWRRRAYFEGGLGAAGRGVGAAGGAAAGAGTPDLVLYASRTAWLMSVVGL